MLENVKLCGYDVPTPIQAYCLPAILMNHDVIAVAQTGKSSKSPSNHSIGTYFVALYRLWKDCSFPYSDYLQING